MKLSLKEQIELASTDELEARFQLYSNLQSRGVKDEFILTLLEQELAQRELSDLYEVDEYEYYN